MSESSNTLKAHQTVAVYIPALPKPTIFIEGEDRKSFLQGITSQDIEKQDVGNYTYALFLNPKARILFDAWCSIFPDRIGLHPSPGTREPFLSHLKKYLFFRTNARIIDNSQTYREIRIFGPQTFTLLLPFFESDHATSSIRSLKGGGWAFIRPLSFQYELPVGPHIDILVPENVFPTLANELSEGAKKMGGSLLDDIGYLCYMTEKGIPLFPSELNESHFPAEAGLDNVGVSYNKGCYVGQEPVTRLKFQGHLNRQLSGFVLPDVSRTSLSSFPLTITNPADGSEAGTLTRAVYSTTFGKMIGLGYLKNTYLEANTELLLPDANKLYVHPLPFS